MLVPTMSRITPSKQWLRRYVRRVLAEVPPPLPPTVTFRTMTICFSERTVDLDGRRIGPIDTDCVSLPILSGDAIFLPRPGQERIA